MGLVRVLEPEVMDTEEEASDYDAMDHADVNASFCDDLLAEGPALGRMLDVGTGTALIPIALCGREPAARIFAVDMAAHMLAVARRNVTRAGFDDRIRLERRDAKATGLDDASFDTVVSNSLVHHVPNPIPLFRELWRLVAPRGLLFVRDLLRPDNEGALRTLVERYAPIASDSNDPAAIARRTRQRALFEASLRAALTLGEVAAAAAAAGLEEIEARVTSDRHWTLTGRWSA
jgi:ubiquinone/menaquinone biosynthesis C-methylase UbiE